MSTSYQPRSAGHELDEPRGPRESQLPAPALPARACTASRTRPFVIAVLTVTGTLTMAAARPADGLSAALGPDTCTFGGRYQPACRHLAGAADGWYEPAQFEGLTTLGPVPVRTSPVR